MGSKKSAAPVEAGRWGLKDILKRQPPMSWVALAVSILALVRAITKP